MRGKTKAIRGGRTFLMSTVCAAALATPALGQELPSREEMWRIIQQQQAQIEALQRRQETTDRKVEATEQKIEVTEQKVEATGAAVEQVAASGGGGASGGWWDRTSLGGYGELHYNGGDKDEVDFHRFVLFIGHEFNDYIRFFAEVELEHAVAGDGQEGEVELEQAFVEIDIAENHALTAGVQLIPVGILNEVHEPPTFYGVERNQVETQIIPTTWWEAAAGAHGQLGGGFSYNALLHSGLEVDPATFDIRGGRQKVSEAPAEDGAVTGRLKWTGMPGVELSTTLQYQSDITQGANEAEALLFEAHVDAEMAAGPGRIGFRALGAVWDIDNATAEALGADEQYGWYVEPSYRFPIWYGDLGVFTRYAMWDERAGDSIDSARSQVQVGANYWPHPDVVFKVDYQFDDFEDSPSSEDDRVNLGFGYQF